jgi:hypothetical protein
MSIHERRKEKNIEVYTNKIGYKGKNGQGVDKDG